MLDRQLARMAKDAEGQQAVIVASKGLIQSMGVEIDRLIEKIGSGLGTDIDRHKFVVMQARFVETSANLKSVITGAAQSTNAGRIRTTNVVTGQQLNHSEMVRQLQDNVDNLGGREAIDKIARNMRLAKQKNGISGVMKVAEGVTTTGKVLQEYWINSILSGLKTQMANISGNAVMSVAIPVEKIAGGVVRRDPKAIREGMRHVQGVLLAAKDSTYYAFEALKREANIIDPESAILEANGINTHAIRSNRDDALGMIINVLGQGIRLPSRGLTTMDEFFKQLNYRADLYAKLHVEAYDLVKAKQLAKADVGRWVTDRIATGFNKDGSARHLRA